MYALCSLYDKWMDFNMRPMEMMMHSELCCSLLVKSIFCLPCIYVLNVIISMAAGSFLLSSIPELFCHCYEGRLNKQTMTVSFSLNDKWMNMLITDKRG
jgi:hypothetical protein